MTKRLSRRAAIGGAAAVTAATALAAAPTALAAVDPPGRPAKPTGIPEVYAQQKAAAGGVWHTHVATLDAEGNATEVIADDADRVTYGYSVQKLAVATAVLDKVDRGELTLDTKTDLTADVIATGTGIYNQQRVYGDQLTVAGFLTAMLLVSDNTAVRLCGRFVPTVELNEILAAKGFVQTRVQPASVPNRFFLGVTTPREMHDLLRRLATKTLLSTASCDFMLGVMRWLSGYHDGVRRNMSSEERSRVATKYGAATDDSEIGGAARHEAGIMFGPDGSPALTYAMYANGHPDTGNFGATHPVVQAHAVLGRALFDSIGAAPAGKGGGTDATGTGGQEATSGSGRGARVRHTVPPFEPYKGG